MATTNSLIINSVDQASKKNQKTLTDINPDANTAALKTFATKLNAITTNSLGSIAKVTREEFDPSITYHDIVWTLMPEGTGVTSDTSTNTVTVTRSQLPALSTDMSEWAGFKIMCDINVNGASHLLPALQTINTLRITYKMDSWTKDPSSQYDDVFIPLFPDFTNPASGGTSFYSMYIVNTGDIYPCTAYITLPAGSFISGNTTYYYNESVVTVNFV